MPFCSRYYENKRGTLADINQYTLRNSWEIYPTCFSREGVDYHCSMDCLRGFELQDLLGRGQWGTVYSACRDHDCNVAIKFVALEKPIPTEDCDIRDSQTDLGDCGCTTEDEFIQEAEKSEILSSLGIGPEIYGWWICEDVYNDVQGQVRVGAIAMEKFGISLRSWIRIYEPGPSRIAKFHELVEDMARVLDDAGYVYGDLHAGNVMVMLDDQNQVVRVGLVDAAELKPVKKKSRKNNVWRVSLLMREVGELLK